jgi:hypothetical protein
MSIQPYGQFGQEPERSQATGMALVCCILSKSLWVVCHSLPTRLDVPTYAANYLHFNNDARDPSSERWNYERECCPVILAKWRQPRRLRIFYLPQIYDMGLTAVQGILPRWRISVCFMLRFSENVSVLYVTVFRKYEFSWRQDTNLWSLAWWK